MLTPEQIAEEFTAPAEYEEIQDLDANYAVLRKTVRELLSLEDQGQADSEDVDATIGQAIEDHAQNQLDIFELEVEADYADQPPSIQMGAALAEVLSMSYEDSGAGIAEMSQVAGMDPEELTACFYGQAVPTLESAAAIADHYLTDDEEAYQNFLLLAQDAEEEGEEDDDEEEDEAILMNAEVEGLRAEFAAMQKQQEVGVRLRQLERTADQMFDQNLLTSVERNTLLRTADFREDPDSVAVFCEFCAANSTEPHTYLDNVEFALNWKAQAGPSNYGVFFSQMVNESVEGVVPETDFVQQYRSRNGYQ